MIPSMALFEFINNGTKHKVNSRRFFQFQFTEYVSLQYAIHTNDKRRLIC